jgi:hypothetical protein
MRKSITFSTDSDAKLSMLIRYAREIGISTYRNEENARKEDAAWLRLSEDTLAKDWLNPVEDVWDTFIKAKLNAQ